MADDPDAVAVIFGATSFTDLLDNVDLLSRIGRQDERIAAEVTTARLRTAETTARVRDAHAEALTNEREVAELKKRGVKFEDYDLPGMKKEGSIFTGGGAKAAWFKDPEGNILAVIQEEA